MMKFGYAGANSVDGSNGVIAMEVAGVENGNVYLSAEDAEYLMHSLIASGVKVPEGVA